jgi:hypothetical protein
MEADSGWRIADSAERTTTRLKMTHMLTDRAQAEEQRAARSCPIRHPLSAIRYPLLIGTTP